MLRAMAVDHTWTRIGTTAAVGDTDGDTQIGSAPTPPSIIREPSQLPRQIGHFTVLGVLGEGGMGTVYDAYDASLGRRVAIKLVRAARAASTDDSGQSRLLREAQAMARLSHPNVLQIYEVGQYDEAIFLALELVPGGDLRAWLGSAPRTWKEVVAIFLEAGRGLAAAHAAGIVHRDFKPENVLVSRDGLVKVADFGLAHAQTLEGVAPSTIPASPSDQTPLLTQEGELVGTPAYMSPEQYNGKPADARSDQFSYCVALYEALYGRRPFTGQSVAELCLRIVGPREPLPSDRRVPAWLRHIIERGLKVDAEQRFPDMGTLLRELSVDRRRSLKLTIVGGAVLAAAIGGVLMGQRGARSCNSGSAQIATVWNRERSDAIERTFLATDISYATDTWSRVKGELDTYAQAWAEQRDDACAATYLRGDASGELLDLRNTCLDDRLREFDALVDALAVADAATVERGVQFVSGLTAPTRCADDRFVRERVAPPGEPALADAVDRARTHLARAAARREAGRPRESREIASAVHRSSEELDYLPLRAEALLELGRSEEATAAGDLALGHLLSAYDLALGIGHDTVATDAAIALILTHLRVARFPEAFAWSEHARSLLQRTGERPEQRVWYLLYRSYTQTRIKLFDDAIASASEGVTLAEASFPPNDPRTARMVAGLGHARWAGGSPDEGLALFLRSQEILRASVGRDHPAVASAGINISSIYLGRSQWSEALAALSPALEIMERAYGPESPNVADCLLNLSSILAATGELREAVAASQRAAAIYLRHSVDNNVTAALLTHLGELQTQQGQYDAARSTLRGALGMRRGAATRHSPAELHVLIADAFADARRGEAAELEYQAALARLGQDPDRDIHRAVLRGGARLAREHGRLDAAIALAREALALDDPEVRHDQDEQASLNRERAPVLRELGEALFATGQIEPAQLACKEALSLANSSYGPGTPLTLNARLCLARVFLAGENRSAALEVLTPAAELAAHGEHAPALRGEIWATLADAVQPDDPERAVELRRRAIAAYREAGPAFTRDADALAAVTPRTAQ